MKPLYRRHPEAMLGLSQFVTDCCKFGGGSLGLQTVGVVRGSVTWKVRGQPDKQLHVGDSFFNPRGSAHSLIAGKSGAKVFSVWIVDKNKPLSSPAP